MRVAHGSAVGLDQLGGRIIVFQKMGKAAGWFSGDDNTCLEAGKRLLSLSHWQPDEAGWVEGFVELPGRFGEAILISCQEFRLVVYCVRTDCLLRSEQTLTVIRAIACCARSKSLLCMVQSSAGNKACLCWGLRKFFAGREAVPSWASVRVRFVVTPHNKAGPDLLRMTGRGLL
jgi:hypothetical protein